MIVFVVMDLVLFISRVLVLDLTHVMAIFLGVVIMMVRHVMNAVVLVLMVMVAEAMVEMGMVLNLMKVLMVLMVLVLNMFESMFVPFNTSRVILEAERLDLVDLPTSLSVWPGWPLHLPLPQLDPRLDPVSWLVIL